MEGKESIPRKPPDEWVVASDHDITWGWHSSGDTSDTYYNDGEFLVGNAVYNPLGGGQNSFSIDFDFSNEHYKQVKVEAKTDIFGYDGEFKVYAHFTVGDSDYLGCFGPGSDTHTFTVDKNRVLNKIRVDYWQEGTLLQRKIYIDLINALWTWIP